MTIASTPAVNRVSKDEARTALFNEERVWLLISGCWRLVTGQMDWLVSSRTAVDFAVQEDKPYE